VIGCPWRAAFTAGLVAVLVSCSSGGGSSTPTPPVTGRVVTLSWAANRETGVNAPGGGYRLSISGQSPVDVPYASGPLAPTTKDVTLPSGSYTVTVTAYAALDAQGGAAGSTSAPSQAITVDVP
jgi:hypothetical protein